MRRLLKIIVIVLSASGFTALLIILMIKFTPKPPLKEIDHARETLAQAGVSKAGTYSRKLYVEAEAAFDSAMANWKRENEKFIFFRDYEKVKEFATASARKGKQAAESSVENSNNLKAKLKGKIDSLKVTESEIDNLFGRYPLQAETRSRISKGKMLLKEGRVAFEKGQYLTANTKITDSEYLLSEVLESAKEELREYFRDFPKWKKWIQSSISESRRNNSITIIVDKFSRKCYIYQGGTIKHEFDAELGRNWVGIKRKMGDKATPEGVYKIVKKYQGKETQYYKALAIDYPNADDRERFRREIEKGTLPASARIGGGIEIHGGGGKGVDWTEGCVALTNTEVDIVYNLARIGTTVTIVGSMKPLDEILKK